MVSLVAALYGVVVAAGIGLCLLGIASVRWWDEPASTLFGLYVGLWGLLPLVDAVVDAAVGFAGFSGFFWVVAVIPWFLFSLAYTGRPFSRVSWLVVTLPTGGLLPWFWSVATGAGVTVFEVVGILVFVYYTALAIIGSLAVVQATARYGHLSLAQGVWLALAGVIPALTMNVFGVLAEQVGETVLVGVYASGLVASCVVVSLALFVDDVFDATPAAGTIGERAVLSESEDAIFITDGDERTVRHNVGAARITAFEGEPAGQPLADVLGYSVEELASEETVSLQTGDGLAQFDPQVTALTDQHDRRIGSMVSLRDITDRERRRQRLEVLNRIVRHNLRNQASVVKANAEVVAEELSDDQLTDRLDAAMDSVDSLTELSNKAKRIQRIIDKSAGPAPVDIGEMLDEIAAESATRWPAAMITVDQCPDETVETDKQALRFALTNLVENGIEHSNGDPAVTLSATLDPAQQPYPVTVSVVDNGPGLPDREVDVLDSGTETQLKHGSGLGLWVTNWTVRELGGTLSFPDRGPDGTTAVVRLPAAP